MIATTLIRDFETKIYRYFANVKWKYEFNRKIKHINHDEPWLTLVACYSIFGDQQNITSARLAAINDLLNSGFQRKQFNFTEVHKVVLETKLPEIKKYREFLKNEILNNQLHFYPDRLEEMEKKANRGTASFEGNTNLDLMIEGISNGKKTSIFIEAKFLSDISYHTFYNPVRDQIARNIDCGIDYVKVNHEYAESLSDFYFLLLTPKVFRTKLFGISNNSLNKMGSDRSRLYCYKMNDYKNSSMLKAALPHRNLQDDEWDLISKHLGWITFEDVYDMSKNYRTIDDPDEANEIKDFFKERNLI